MVNKSKQASDNLPTIDSVQLMLLWLEEGVSAAREDLTGAVWTGKIDPEINGFARKYYYL